VRPSTTLQATQNQLHAANVYKQKSRDITSPVTVLRCSLGSARIKSG